MTEAQKGKGDVNHGLGLIGIICLAIHWKYLCSCNSKEHFKKQSHEHTKNLRRFACLVYHIGAFQKGLSDPRQSWDYHDSLVYCNGTGYCGFLQAHHEKADTNTLTTPLQPFL